MRLRYTGPTTVTFMESTVGEVNPGDEFSVSDELIAGFVVREDVTVVHPVDDSIVMEKPQRNTEPSPSGITSDGEETGTATSTPEMKSEENNAVSHDR